MEHIGDTWFLGLITLVLIAAVVGWLFLNAFRIIGPVIFAVAAVVLFFGIADAVDWIHLDNNGSSKASITDSATQVPTQPAATATGTSNVSISTDDPRVSQIATGIKNGTIKSAKDLDTAINNATPKFTNDQIKAVQAQLAMFVQSGSTPTAGNGTNGQPGSNVSFTQAQPSTYQFPTPGNLDNVPKGKIDTAPLDTWFHRVFNESLFHAPNWDGADSWFVSLALGRNSGGNWTSMGNPGQIVYRGTSTNINWCLGVLTTSQWKSQFLSNSNASLPAAVNVRIAPNAPVSVTGPSGTNQVGTTSDAGDITIVVPDSGVVTICVAYVTAAPTHESLVWWGPYDRSQGINTIDASK